MTPIKLFDSCGEGQSSESAGWRLYGIEMNRVKRRDSQEK